MTWQEDGWFQVHGGEGWSTPSPFEANETRRRCYCVSTVEGARICVVRKKILRAEPGRPLYRLVFDCRKDPAFNLCQAGMEDSIGRVFPESEKSQPVRIFSSSDGGIAGERRLRFQRVNLPRPSDPLRSFESAIWVCTGDRDAEVAILKTTDGFRTLTPVVQGNPLYRTTV